MSRRYSSGRGRLGRVAVEIVEVRNAWQVNLESRGRL